MSGDGYDVRSLACTYPDNFVIGGHAHRWSQLVHATSGMMEVRAGQLLWFVPPTRAIWIPAGVDHAIAMKGRVGLRTLYVAPSRGTVRAIGALEVAPLLRELVLHILAREMLAPGVPEQDRLAAVLVDLIAAARDLDLALPLPRDPRALRLARRLMDMPEEKAPLERLGPACGASLRTLQRLFADETGMPIERWRQKARMVRAAGVLGGGASVTEAALACGYDSLSAFVAAFRRQFGVTPGRFRA
jgi:AraC-like DNA-binding protein